MHYKTCGRCNETKSLDMFYKRKNSGDGHQAYCKQCSGAIARTHRLQAIYGITPQDYHALFAAQNGKCAICSMRSMKKKLFVDHCHTTNKVRGLLCHRCNASIGLLREDIGILQRAIKYLEEHSPNE